MKYYYLFLGNDVTIRQRRWGNKPNQERSSGSAREAIASYVNVQGNYVEKCSGINTFFALTMKGHISIIIQMVTVCVIVH